MSDITQLIAGAPSRVQLPIVAFMGDSITQACSNIVPFASGGAEMAASLRSAGYGAWAEVFNGNGFRLANYGVGGEKATDMLSRVPASCALNPTLAVVLAGTNDLNAGSTAAATFTALQALWNAYQTRGIPVIACTVMPRINTAPGYLNVGPLNQMIRNYCVGPNKPMLADFGTLGISTNSDGRNAGTAWYYDGIHPNSSLAQRAGKVLAQVIRTYGSGLQYFPPSLPGPAGTLVATANPWMTGNVGGLATGYTNNLNGAATSTPSKVARTDSLPGEWQRLTITSSAPVAAADFVNLQHDASGGWAVGDSVYIAVRVKIVSGTFNRLDFRCRNLTGTTVFWACFDDGAPSAGQVTPYDLPAGQEFVFVSDRQTIPTGATNMLFYSAIGGNGVIDIGPWQMYKI